MASHFSSIGCPVASFEELQALAEQASVSAATRPVGSSSYLHWHGADGAELWLQVSERRELIGIAPHFMGSSRMRVGLTRRHPCLQGTALDGSFHAWADPQSSEPESGCYPFLFDAPDAALYEHVVLPTLAIVQLAAFAEELTVFGSLAEYEESRDASEIRFAAEAFIPAGLFSRDLAAASEPTAHAVIAGRVEHARVLTNALTGTTYYWICTRTLGGVIDVVSDASLVAREPVPGGVVLGSFWLSGRILESFSGPASRRAG